MLCLGFRYVSRLKCLIERIPMCFIQRLRQWCKIDQLLHRKCGSLLGHEWWLRMRAAVSSRTGKCVASLSGYAADTKSCE
jgi:hypothetical protein